MKDKIKVLESGYITLTDKRGKSRGVHIPNDDQDLYTRCVSCKVIIENEPRTPTSQTHCWFCKN